MASNTFTWDQAPPAACRQGALTIGNFDGVHRGHQALLAALRRQADTGGGPAVVLTFDPHPLQLLHPERFQPLLTTPVDRVQLLRAAGADQVLVLHTTADLLQVTAPEFFQRVIRDGIQPRAVVEGANFGFGRNREGTVATLDELCRGSSIRFQMVPPLELDGTAVSSSRVRFALLRGAVREAAALLDRPYRLRGTVGVGQRRGATLGFPTANLVDVANLVPGDGVYAVRVERADGSGPGAANIGPNPTFGEQARKVEVHLIGFQGDLYGQPLAVDFLERLRDTRPFPNVAELVAQLRRDVDQARQTTVASQGAHRE